VFYGRHTSKYKQALIFAKNLTLAKTVFILHYSIILVLIISLTNALENNIMVSNKLMNAIVGLAGIATLGLSSLGFAGGPYEPTPAPAAGCDEGRPNFYIAGRVGWGDNHWDDISGAVFGGFDNDFDVLEFGRVHVHKHTSVAAGVEIGYAFNKYLAVEFGYMYLPKAHIRETIFDVDFDTRTDTIFVNVGDQRNHIRNYAFDLMARISIPLPGIDNVGMFAKAGVSYLKSTGHRHHHHHHHRNNLNINNDHNRIGHVNNTNLTYAFGGYWNFTPNMTLDIEFQRFHGDSKFGHHDDDRRFRFLRHDYQPFMDAYTVGLTYHNDSEGSLFNT
jgi:opacity protein-like surface antigen